MRKHELPNCPQWLLNANTENENVEIDQFGRLVWYGGVWRGGVWCGGVWCGGEWCGGEWRGGEWRGGEWNGGEWYDGVWYDGVWRGGEWRGGSTTPKSKYIPLIIDDRCIRIGCKTKTIEEWNEWFASDEEYETKRGTEQFAMIHAHYLAAKTYHETMEQYRKETKQ